MSATPDTGGTPDARWPMRPADPVAAEDHLQAGRNSLATGDRDAALGHFRAAMACDPSVACKPWGLLPLLEAEGRANFQTRMEARLQSWYRPPRSPVHAGISALSNKDRMRRYIADFGLPLPRLYAGPVALDQVPWDSLPDRVVIKPENGSNSHGVIVAVGGIDQMTGARIGGDLHAYAQKRHRALFGTALPPVMVEEALVDIAANADPTLAIPRDFKVYCVAGHAGMIRVHDRNGPKGRRGLLTCDRAGRALPLSHSRWPQSPPAPVPQGWESLIGMAEALSRAQPWLLRLDFYLTPRGPVFGEFTTYPNAGRNLTPFARSTLLQMWEIFPD